MKVLITHAPNRYRNVGEIDVGEISNVRWDNISGGVHIPQAGYFLYGYIDYNRAAELVDCRGEHRFSYNEAKICIPASLNKEPPYKEGYRYLAECAGEKPPGEISAQRPVVFPPCTKYILSLLAKNGKTHRSDLRHMVVNEAGYRGKTWMHAVRRMRSDNRIKVTGGDNYHQQYISLPEEGSGDS